MKSNLSGLKVVSMFKALVFVLLATLSFNAFAYNVYLGNPTRPNTIWVPGHYEGNCWVNGYYMMVLSCVKCRDLVWVDDGSWAGGHWQLRSYRIIDQS